MSASTSWPPRSLTPILNRYAEWSAWYAGDRGSLESIGGSHGVENNPAGGITGMVGRVWRRFWGGSTGDSSTLPRIKVHVPLAADIARASSDLLFAEPPTIGADKPPAPAEGEPVTADYAAGVAIAQATTDRLAEYVDAGLIGVFAGAAEVGAAMSGVFLRGVVDHDRRVVFATRVDVDNAIPEFEWGRLVRVTFWKELPALRGSSSMVYRWFEIHETVPGEYDGQAARVGVIRHQLFRGTADDLGDPVDLTAHPFTEQFVPLLDAELGDGISTLTPGLDVVYIPNVTPNPLWRGHPVGANLGAPDIAGAEDLLDRLDHVYSSLMEELDLAKARITIPEAWLMSNGPGRGVSFDNDRRVFTALSIAPTSADARAELFQPSIRVDEHLRIMQQLTEDILRRCGYSAATFGEDEEGAVTATGVNAKTARSRLTRSRKLRHWAPGVTELLEKMLAMDVAHGFADPLVEPSLVSVVFPEAQQTPLELAQTVGLWNSAAAASVWIKVATVHPDWDDEQIRAEVDRIKTDAELPALTSPEDLTGDTMGAITPTAAVTMTPEDIAAAANAMGVLIRAGVEPSEAATRVGLPGLPFTGAVPTSLRLPEKDASTLEPA